ncbi:hypothetical protein ACRAWF_05820 [Streptomyces sp. L7]
MVPRSPRSRIPAHSTTGIAASPQTEASAASGPPGARRTRTGRGDPVRPGRQQLPARTADHGRHPGHERRDIHRPVLRRLCRLRAAVRDGLPALTTGTAHPSGGTELGVAVVWDLAEVLSS